MTDLVDPARRGTRLAAFGYLLLIYLLALGYTLLIYTPADDAAADLVSRLHLLRNVDLLLGHALFPLMLVRRRHPVLVAVVMGCTMVISAFTSLLFLFALITVAARCARTWIAACLLLIPISSAIYTLTLSKWLWRDDAEHLFSLTSLGNSVYGLVLGLVFALLGWNIGAREELVDSHHAQERAHAAEREARAAQARMAERARIARDMHDALGHRLTLVSMHSAGMAYLAQGEGPDVRREDVHRVAGTVAEQSKAALEELREILGVLRSDAGTAGIASAAGADVCSPGVEGDSCSMTGTGLEGIEQLVEEMRQRGSHVELRCPEDFCHTVGRSLPVPVSQHGYRVVQEALTNAGKHAPGEPVSVWLAGGPGEGLDVRVSNPMAAGSQTTQGVVSGGLGLLGMQERIDLAGGRLATGEDHGRFVVDAWLPWPAEGARP